MPFSHHSHSGQFCNHGKDQLEDVIKQAVSRKLSVYCLTEHMPREELDHYPEEEGADLFSLFEEYVITARRLQKTWMAEIQLFVGMEIDWIRSSSKDFVEGLLAQHHLDFIIGSVHHVHEIPIDYSNDLFQKAIERSGSLEGLYEDYFDSQYEMIQALKPPIIGHFDLIRLKSEAPNGSFQRYQGVWAKIIRNLEAIKAYGGILELNSAALRKGLDEPYPIMEICKAFASRGGSFTLSDDAHGVDQVCAKYSETLEFAESIPLSSMACLKCAQVTPHDRGAVTLEYFNLKDLKAHPFFLTK